MGESLNKLNNEFFIESQARESVERVGITSPISAYSERRESACDASESLGEPRFL